MIIFDKHVESFFIPPLARQTRTGSKNQSENLYRPHCVLRKCRLKAEKSFEIDSVPTQSRFKML